MKKYILVTTKGYFLQHPIYNQIFEIYAEAYDTYDFRHTNGGCCRIKKVNCIEGDSIEYLENIKYLS